MEAYYKSTILTKETVSLRNAIQTVRGRLVVCSEDDECFLD